MACPVLTRAGGKVHTGAPGSSVGGWGRGPVARHGTHTFPESFDHVKNGKMAEDVGRLPGESEEIKE